MKWILCVGLWCGCWTVTGQVIAIPDFIGVSSQRTVSLVFPANIVSVDRGSEQILVQKAAPNILKVKADSIFSDTTNVTIVTTDGKLYSFLVGYVSAPLRYVIDLSANSHVLQDTALAAFAQRVRQASSYVQGVRFSSGHVWVHILGLYSDGIIMAIKLRVLNRSSFSYEFGAINAYTTQKRTGKRRASQEIAIPILLQDAATQLVRERQSAELVVLLPKSGLVEGQMLLLELHEKGSYRQLILKIAHHQIITAKLLK
jgi:hypothetical protein